MLGSGSVLSDRYRLDERVATGGMGDVWRATDLVLGREVAVKVLLPSLLTDPSFIARFRAEARMMAALHHPGIVQVYDCGTDHSPDGAPADYLVMEYVAGVPLSQRIDAAGGLSIAETMSVIAQAATALHAAHTNGIVHRDVKPSNLLVQPDGTVVLVDFGVARSTTVTSITSTNAIPGTALYMAPEQAAGKPVSPATDIYALGAVAFCCLTGNPPFVGQSPLEVAVRHLHDEPPALPEDIPPAVSALVYRALAKDPAERFPSAAAMADAAYAATGAPGAADPTMATRPLGAAALGGGAAGGALAGGAARANGPATQADMRPVPVDAPRSRRTAALGVVAAVVLALAGLTAAVAFRTADDPTRGTGGTPLPTVTTAPANDAPTVGVQPLPTGTNRTAPTARTTRPSAAATSAPATAKPSPTKSAVPTTVPTQSAPPTGNPATSAPVPVTPSATAAQVP